MSRCLHLFVAAFHNHLPAAMSSDPVTDATVSNRDPAADAAVDATQETTGYQSIEPELWLSSRLIGAVSCRSSTTMTEAVPENETYNRINY